MQFRAFGRKPSTSMLGMCRGLNSLFTINEYLKQIAIGRADRQTCGTSCQFRLDINQISSAKVAGYQAFTACHRQALILLCGAKQDHCDLLLRIMSSPLLASLLAATPIPTALAPQHFLMSPMTSVAAATYSARFQMLLNALLERFPADLGLVQVGPASAILAPAFSLGPAGGIRGGALNDSMSRHLTGKGCRMHCGSRRCVRFSISPARYGNHRVGFVAVHATSHASAQSPAPQNIEWLSGIWQTCKSSGRERHLSRVLQFWTLPNCQEWSSFTKQQLRQMVAQTHELPCYVNAASLKIFRQKW